MVKFRLCGVFLVVLTLSPSFIKGDVDIITRRCRFEGCYDLEEGDARFSGVNYNRKLAQLFSAGIPQLIYGDIPTLVSTLDSSISKSCGNQLTTISKSIDNGREWAYRFIDASGKTPTAFLVGTVTSFGDYDECLEIRAPQAEAEDIAGKYCLVDIFPKAYKANSKDFRKSGQIDLLTPRHFNESAYYFGLCFPSACSPQDVRVLVKKVLEPFPLLVDGELNCDTQESISFKAHITNIRLGPFISLLFLVAVGSAVTWGTVNHALEYILGGTATPMQKSFSVIENIHKLFYVSSQSANRTDLIDWVKNVGIAFGTAAHVMCCLESPIGFFVLSHHHNLVGMISNPATIPLFNEAGIIAFTFLSGAACFMVCYPAAARGRLSFVPLLIDRILRHLPGVMSIVALDFTWYMWSSGPFYSRVGKIHVDKCSKTWWKNFLFVSNLWGPSIELCAGHTFFSSVDIHLFIMGFVAVALLASRPKLGTIYCLSLVVIGKSLTYYYATTRNLTPTLMVPREPSIHGMEEFLIYIHMATSGYVPSYMFAILVCYTIAQGWWSKYSVDISHKLWIGAFFVSSTLCQNFPVIPNFFNRLAPEWNPLYIVSVRAISMVQMSIFLIYCSLIEAKKAREAKAIQSAESVNHSTGSKPIEEVGYYSVSKAMLRLSFAIYLSNYYFIRTDFFSERTPYYNTLLGYFKRLLSSAFFIVATAFAFQTVFLGPFNNLRVALLHSKRPSDQNKVKGG